MFNLKKKVLFGLSVSMVLAMAIGSFALGESQTQASPQEIEAQNQNSVGANAGAFTVNGGTQGTDYEFIGTTGTDGVLKIHPRSIETNITIYNEDETTDRIEVTSAATITLAGVKINTTTGSALRIQNNATFDVNILLADGSNNILKAMAEADAGYAGLEKGDDETIDIDTLGTLIIGVPYGSAGTGKLQATGTTLSVDELGGAGIGGRRGYNGSKITITGGEIIANGGDTAAGIGGGSNQNGRNITIAGGKVTANGGQDGAGIGGGSNGNGGYGNNITISGGVVTAYGGLGSAGIGGGWLGKGSNIRINGGAVTAYGGAWAAGIGGGYYGRGSNITITGGVVRAYGGGGSSDYPSYGGAGIGGGQKGSGSDNSLNGDAVVLATSGNTAKDALEGFDSLFVQGIAFTGLGTAFDSNGHATEFSWDESGTMYGNVTLSQDLEIPANLTIPAGQILSIKEGKDVTLSEKTGVKYTVEGELRNNGIVTLPADLEVNDEGKVTTAIIYDTQDGTITNADEYKTYQDNSGVKAYSELPNAEKDGYIFEGWYTGKDGEGTKVEETSLVFLNQHILYANWAANPESIPDQSVDPGVKTSDSFTGIAALAILGVATTGAALLRKRK